MQLDNGKDQLIRLQNGPVDNQYRSCTNVICLGIFTLFFIGIVGIGIYAHQHGEIAIVTQGFDSDHRACGVDEQVKEFPFIYFVTPNPDYLWRTVCVSECPAVTTGNTHLLEHQTTMSLKCVTNSVVKSCQATATVNGSDSVTVYDSSVFDNRVCVPRDTKLYDAVFPGLSMTFSQQLFTDLRGAKYTLFVFALIGTLMTIILTYLLRWCSSTVVWFIIVLIVVLSIFFGYYSFQQYRIATAYTIGYSSQGYFITSIIFWGIAILTIVLTICFYKRIRLAIAILRASSDFVISNENILWVPVASITVGLIIFGMLIYFGVLLYSTGTPTDDPKSLPFIALTFTILQRCFAIYLLIGLCWTFANIIGCNNFVIGGAVAIWYWQQGRSGQEGAKPVRHSAIRLFRYHLGTVFLGGFLLGLVSIFSVFLEYLYRNAEYMKNNENCSFCFKCCTCCIWCFERFLQYLNQNIYVQTNMTGIAFFESAKNALEIMSNNSSIVMQVVGLGDLIIGMARFMITMIVTVGFYRFITAFPFLLFGGTVVDAYNPTIALAFIMFIIASLFVGIYGVSIESILHLYCIDEEIARAKNNEQGAEMCPAALREFLTDHVYNQKE